MAYSPGQQEPDHSEDATEIGSLKYRLQKSEEKRAILAVALQKIINNWNDLHIKDHQQARQALALNKE